MIKNKIKIYTLGCKVNQYDSGVIIKKLLDKGFVLDEKKPDFVIVNTCAVTKTAIQKAKRIINKYKKIYPKAELLITGCWPGVYKKEAENMGAKAVCSVGEIDKILDYLNLNSNNNRTNSCEQSNLVSNERARYTIKIQDGCEQFCTYCIIPYTRGKLKSRPEDEVLTEIKEAVKSGFKEVVLSGIHLGLYGVDNNKTNLVSLIKKILKTKNLGRLRLSSIEVTEVTDELINLISTNNKICNHLHIPLQSGCDKILKSMNRPYNKKYFFKKINIIKTKIKNIAITTDVIVGFPGETEKDFRETYEFISKINFSRLHVFPFSAHEQTPAYKFNGQVERSEKINRARELRKLGEKLKTEFRKKFKNKKLNILIENEKDGFYIGKSEEYFDVKINKNKINKINKIKIGEIVNC